MHRMFGFGKIAENIIPLKFANSFAETQAWNAFKIQFLKKKFSFHKQLLWFQIVALSD